MTGSLTGEGEEAPIWLGSARARGLDARGAPSPLPGCSSQPTGLDLPHRRFSKRNNLEEIDTSRANRNRMMGAP